MYVNSVQQDEINKQINFISVNLLHYIKRRDKPFILFENVNLNSNQLLFILTRIYTKRFCLFFYIICNSIILLLCILS